MWIVPDYTGGDVRAINAIGGVLNTNEIDYEWNLALAARRQVMAQDEADALAAEEDAAKLAEIHELFISTLQPLVDDIDANTASNTEDASNIQLLATTLVDRTNKLAFAIRDLVVAHGKLSEVVATQAGVTTDLVNAIITIQDKLPGDTP